MFSIHEIEKHFDGVAALSHITLSFKPGEITSIIGPNGSGKSTLVNVLTGMLPIDGGTVIIGKERLGKIIPHESVELGLGRTFQEVRLFEQMTVMDNLLVVLTQRTVFGSLFEHHEEAHRDQAAQLLQKVGLWEKRNERAATLSYGQRKLLEIARALALKPDIFFFDEPLAGLFPEMVKKVVSYMQELAACGKTVILIEHNMQIVREISKTVIVLDGGVLLAQGTPEHVLAQRNIIEAYLGE